MTMIYFLFNILTKKNQAKFVVDNTLLFFFIRENNPWHFMWIADDSHEMTRLILYEKWKKKKKKKKMLSATIMSGA